MSEPLDLDGIEARANAADGTRWVICGDREAWSVEIHDSNGFRVAIDAGQRDAEHIASMDPPTTLALVAEVRALRAKVAAVEGLADWWDSGPTKHIDTHTNEAAAHRIREVLAGRR